jgi:uncharacterized protein (TIGR00369 family)
MRTHATLPPDYYERWSGLETLEAIVEGKLPGPPIAETLKFRLVSVAPGEAVFEGTPGEESYNPLGSIHGGWTATILDSALACCVHSTLEKGERYTSVEMKVNFIRPIFPGKPARLICRGRVISRGRTLALSEASLVDEAGKVYAHGTETCMIFPKAGSNGA